MAINFKDLKRGSDTSFQKLQQEVANLNKFRNDTDSRFWTPTVDNEGNGTAIIRFLPPIEGEELPFVRMFSHGFEGPTGKWYIENSLTTIGQNDPVSELNAKLWKSTTDEESPARKIAHRQKRRLSYISNIYVLRDSNTENEGKVFLYKYGAKIWDKINAIMHPEFEGDEAVNPFDLWKGANFRLRICKVGGFRNYDHSSFETPSALDSDDEKLESIWKKGYALLPLIAPDQFKSYEELSKKLRDVVGNSCDFAIGGETRDTQRQSEKSEPTQVQTSLDSVEEHIRATAESAPTDQGVEQQIDKQSGATNSDELDQYFKEFGL